VTRFADLHTHTYHSDGTRSPREVVDVARLSGVTILSISDHDNLAAFYEIKAYADEQEVTLIPGIELSCAFEDVDVHILAYAFDPHDDRIDARLRSFRETRQRRGQAIAERLQSLGYPVRAGRIDELAAGGAVGRPHVARALVEAGHVASVDEAFEKFLRAGRPAYVEKERFKIGEAISLIRAAGGVTSVAHPSLYPDHARLVPKVLDSGVDAVEVIHPDVPPADREMYTNMARFRGKFVTGGSDDHGTVKTAQTLGSVRVPESLIGPILDRIR
jgi:predicted metal-dependent phosphoesterase TrpH